MFKRFTRVGLAVAVAAGIMASATTAEARHRHDRGDDAALAIGAGIIGLAIGAAIASDNDRYYDRGYYYYGRPHYVYRTYPRYHRDYRYYPRHHYRHDRRWDRRWDRRRYRGW